MTTKLTIQIVRAAVLAALVLPSRAAAQAAPPAIGPFVVDVRGPVPRFSREPQLAASRGLTELELPGSGLGVDAGAHLYFYRWKANTFGVGGQITLGRSHSSGAASTGQTSQRAVTERF